MTCMFIGITAIMLTEYIQFLKSTNLIMYECLT